MKTSVLLGNDQMLIADLQGTTEQQSATGHVRYYSPDNLDHRTDMLRAFVACVDRLKIIDGSETDQEWLEASELI